MVRDTRKSSSEEVEKVVPHKVTGSSNKISEVTGKLSQMSVSSGAQQRSQQLDKPPPPAMKAGGWHSKTDYLGRSYEIPSARRYSRKVMG